MRWLIIAFSLCSISCATTIRGTYDTISVMSEPSGARVTTDLKAPTGAELSDSVDGFLGCPATPCTIKIPRRADTRVVVAKTGFQSIQYRLVSSATTSNDLLPPGLLLAGLPSGSHVIVADPSAGSQITLRGASIASGLTTFGTTTVIDAASGATMNIVPQAVTVILAPDDSGSQVPETE